jgi:hypothetical protein
MMNTIRKRAALFGSVAALSLALAACSTDADTDTEAPDAVEETATDEDMADEDMAEDEEMAEDMESALTLTPVGEACAAVPADGEGSSEGMADDPVATAASNNPLLSTLVTAVGEAELGPAFNDVTWRQWVYRWDVRDLAPGRHELRCRATDGTGLTQVEQRQPPFPDGATGWHGVVVLA